MALHFMIVTTSTINKTAISTAMINATRMPPMSPALKEFPTALLTTLGFSVVVLGGAIVLGRVTLGFVTGGNTRGQSGSLKVSR